MTNAKLDDFYKWFILNLPYCIEELIQLVRGVEGFESWQSDNSPDSLDVLGNWFVKKVQITGREFDETERSGGSAGRGLTDEIKFLAVYVGMYYGETAIASGKDLRWVQLRGNDRFADFGQPVVAGKGGTFNNPVRVAHSFACGIADGSRSGNRLRETLIIG